MHPVVLDQPYEFVPPTRSRFWPWLLRQFVPGQLRRRYGVERTEVRGLDKLKQSRAAGHSVLLAPNHCRPSDPMIVAEVCRQMGTTPYTMASWHVFMEGRLQRFVLRGIGGFSVYREGLDRQALQASIEILLQSKRPLVIFPEGVVTRTNDRVLALMEGVSFIARSAAKKRAAAKPPGKVVVHPIAIRYHFHGDIDAAVSETLESIERRLSWRPVPEPDLVARIYRVGEALLWLKEIEYFGRPQQGEIADRLQNLIDQILTPLEQEWRNGKTEDTTVGRVKQLRMAILPDIVAEEVSEEEKRRRWNQLTDMYVAQQLGHYPPTYVRSNPTTERLLETVERFEEDLTDVSRIHRPMSATVRIGDAIEVSPKRIRGAEEDPLMAEVDHQLHEMLEIPLPDSQTETTEVQTDMVQSGQ